MPERPCRLFHRVFTSNITLNQHVMLTIKSFYQKLQMPAIVVKKTKNICWKSDESDAAASNTAPHLGSTKRDCTRNTLQKMTLKSSKQLNASCWVAIKENP